MRIGGESTGKKLRKRARAEKTLLRFKQHVKLIKRPVFYCAKRRNLLCRFHEIFRQADLWQLGGKCCKSKVFGAYILVYPSLYRVYEGFMVYGSI